MKLFRKPQKTPKYSFRRWIEIGLKCALMLIWPMPVAAVILGGWYWLLGREGAPLEKFLDEKMGEFIGAAWIPTNGLLYVLLVAAVFTTVWDEYKQIRKAVKSWDICEFLHLCDEGISPLVHVLVGVCSVTLMLSFMAVKYTSIRYGLLINGNVAYVLTLVFLVIWQIDDPCTGLWYIRGIPDEWLKIDPREYRAKSHAAKKKKILEEWKADGIDVKIFVQVSEAAECPPSSPVHEAQAANIS
jgi:hypothetical protein